MANLKKEYTDIKDIKHKVEHLTLGDKQHKEQVVAELFRVLSKQGKRISA